MKDEGGKGVGGREGSLSHEPLGAGRTGVRLFAGVDSAMSIEVVLICMRCDERRNEDQRRVSDSYLALGKDCHTSAELTRVLGPRDSPFAGTSPRSSHTGTVCPLPCYPLSLVPASLPRGLFSPPQVRPSTVGRAYAPSWTTTYSTLDEVGSQSSPTVGGGVGSVVSASGAEEVESCW